MATFASAAARCPCLGGHRPLALIAFHAPFAQDDAGGLYDMDGEDEIWLKLYNERVRIVPHGPRGRARRAMRLVPTCTLPSCSPPSPP